MGKAMQRKLAHHWWGRRYAVGRFHADDDVIDEIYRRIAGASLGLHSETFPTNVSRVSHL